LRKLRGIEAAEDDKKASYDRNIHEDRTGDACDCDLSPTTQDEFINPASGNHKQVV
jgi:hypothetical protein